VLTEEGRTKEAEAYLRESLRLLEANFPAGHPLIEIARSTLGRCLARQGRYEEAEPLLTGPLDALSGHASERVEKLLRGRVVELYRAWGRPADARRVAEASGGGG
jgi:hypothetical protein